MSFTKTKPHLNIGTLGHADHGKTTLAAAITKVLAKNNPKAQSVTFEQIDNPHEQNVRVFTIAVAHVEFETANRRYAHFDCSRHADHVKNLIAGAPQMDGAILVVAATEGLAPEAREQILLARQAGVPAMVVFMNKVDAVDDPQLLDSIELEVRELLNEHEFPGDNIPVVRGSALRALKGDREWEKTVEDLMAAVDSYIPTPQPELEKPFFMAVEDVFEFQGTMATGFVERGKVKVNDLVELVGLRPTRSTVVTRVQMFRQLNEAHAGDNVGLLLHGIDREDVERGQVIAQPRSITPHTKFKAVACLLTKEEGVRHVSSGQHLQFFFRTTLVTGVAHLVVMSEESVVIEVELMVPIAIENGLRFVIREGRTVIGGGTVTEILD